MVDPHDPSQAAGIILDAIADDEARVRGPEHARTFNWEEAANATFEGARYACWST